MLKLPALLSAHSVGILKLPLEHVLPLVLSDDDCQCDFAIAKPAGDAHFLAGRKIRYSALHFKTTVHLGAVPEPHALWNEENKNLLRRNFELADKLEIGHRRIYRSFYGDSS